MSVGAPALASHPGATLSWFGIFRAGLVQTALGAIVVLATSTINRVMVVELALPAMLPGILVALHYGVQISRPRLGYGSDVGGRRTPWIVGGMAVLAIGGIGAAAATALMAVDMVAGIALAVVAFAMIGLGVGAAGTSLLVLLATNVVPRRRAAAATIVWLMMIMGFVVTATLAGHFLDPFSTARLVAVAAVVAAVAFAVALLALWRLERRDPAPRRAAVARGSQPPFRRALAQVWAEPRSRRFAIFVFLSMIAYSMQDLVLEPFAGSVFDYTPGASTQLAGLQHAGVLAGMILVAIAVSGFGDRRGAALRAWTVGGCIASCAAILALAVAAVAGPGWPLKATVFALGAANGVYAIAAIGSMMQFVGEGMAAREGVRMGLWGAAQAIAFGIGGFLGTAIADVFRVLTGSAAHAYAVVFAVEGILFLAAAVLAASLDRRAPVGASPMAGTLAAARIQG